MTQLLIWMVPILRVFSEVLTAGIAISTFSLFLFMLYFVKKERLARVFALVLICLTVVYSADALGTTSLGMINLFTWQKIHWSGFVFLPAFFFHFSETLLTMTGQIQRRLRRIGVVLIYLCSLFFLLLLWQNRLFEGIKTIDEIGATLIPSQRIGWFWIFFGILLVLSLVNFWNTFWRTRTRTSRRRMAYLITSSVAILLGTFPLLIFGFGSVAEHPFLFWLTSALANLVILFFVFLLGYSVTTFCVSWSSRVIRLRLFEWMLRGPLTACITLGFSVLVKRGSGIFGVDPSGLISMLTVLAIVGLEFLITLLLPRFERNSLSGYGNEDYMLLNGLEKMVVFKPELETYLESLISALTDRFQAKGAFIAPVALDGKIENYIRVGEADWEHIEDIPHRLNESNGDSEELILDDSGILCPIVYHENGNGPVLLAILGLSGTAAEELDEEHQAALRLAIEKARAILWQRRFLSSAFTTLRQRTDADPLNSFRDMNPLDQSDLLSTQDEPDIHYVSGYVRDALTHYWGGPRLTENPLMNWDVVRQELQTDEANPSNALRSVLRKAIERLRPEGERNISGEWVLYNILDLKFIEGKRVKEVAQKLAISEADLYRKQKVAIEEIAKTILKMEKENRTGEGESNKKSDN